MEEIIKHVAKRLAELSFTEERYLLLVKDIHGSTINQLEAKGVNLSEEKKEELFKIIKDTISLREQLDLIAEFWAEHLSLDELEVIAVFYQTVTGQKLLDNAGRLGARIQNVVFPRINSPAFFDKVERLING